VLLSEIATIDDVLSAHGPALGADVTPYRNHVYRVFNLAAWFAPNDAGAHDKLAVVAAFHDLGIWTDGTFDYLEPSIRRASAYLVDCDRAAWVPEVSAMIGEHHKLSPYRSAACPLVEPFRRADWIDVTLGWRRFGVPGAFVRELYGAWPGAGFHRRLVQLSLARARRHPLAPLPMVRW
jgi:hypothetical protein